MTFDAAAYRPGCSRPSAANAARYRGDVARPSIPRAVRSSTAGGANMGALGLLAQMGWSGGTIDPSAAAVMIHR
jgi:hypothetical protein